MYFHGNRLAVRFLYVTRQLLPRLRKGPIVHIPRQYFVFNTGKCATIFGTYNNHVSNDISLHKRTTWKALWRTVRYRIWCRNVTDKITYIGVYVCAYFRLCEFECIAKGRSRIAVGNIILKCLNLSGAFLNQLCIHFAYIYVHEIYFERGNCFTQRIINRT